MKEAVLNYKAVSLCVPRKVSIHRSQPTHQVRHICRHTSQLTKLTCKRACLVPTLLGETPCIVGHILSIQVTKTKGEHTTGSLLLCWQTNIFSASYRYQPISSRRKPIGISDVVGKPLSCRRLLTGRRASGGNYLRQQKGEKKTAYNLHTFF